MRKTDVPGNFVNRSVAGLCLGLVALMSQPGHGQASNTATFFQNYIVTGDYVAFGVGLKGTGSAGFATGGITVPAGTVPALATPVAAFLYWSTVVSLSSPASGLTGATFKGHDISAITRILNPSGTSPCWSAGGGAGPANGSRAMILHRADVLRYLDLDASGQVIVNATHEVRLPDSGSGGSGTPFTLGASLVVVYRNPGDPLRAISVYDGGFSMNQGADSVVMDLRGFYQASTTAPQAKMTVILGEGQDNFSERLLLNGNLVATNPFIGAAGPAWDNATFDVSPWLVAGSGSATVSIDHGTFTPYDCLTGGAVVLSTTVQDTDRDGLLDTWESSTTGVTDPNGRPLPNFNAMGANPLRKDLFVEVGYMVAGAGTTVRDRHGSSGRRVRAQPFADTGRSRGVWQGLQASACEEPGRLVRSGTGAAVRAHWNQRALRCRTWLSRRRTRVPVDPGRRVPGPARPRSWRRVDCRSRVCPEPDGRVPIPGLPWDGELEDRLPGLQGCASRARGRAVEPGGGGRMRHGWHLCQTAI